jgi:PEP-CTERM motif-containing protein
MIHLITSRAKKWEGLAIGPRLSDGHYVILAGTDNDFSVTQNASSIQLDVYYNPNTGARSQCDIGTFDNCTSINADGTLGSSYDTSTPAQTAGFALIPSVLSAYKTDGQDLATYITPVPEPETWVMMLAGLGMLGFAARRHRV